MSVLEFSNAAELRAHRASLKDKFRNLKVVPITNSDNQVFVPLVRYPRGDDAVCGIYGEVPQRVDGFLPAKMVNAPTAIMEIVAKFYGCEPIDIRTHCRVWKIVRPRHVFFYLCRRMTTKSYPEIARICGGRDHTTVLAGCRSIEALLGLDTHLAEEVETLRGQVNMRLLSLDGYRLPAIEMLGA